MHFKIAIQNYFILNVNKFLSSKKFDVIDISNFFKITASAFKIIHFYWKKNGDFDQKLQFW